MSATMEDLGMDAVPPISGSSASTSGRAARRGSMGGTIGRWMQRPGKGSNHSKPSTPENTDALDSSIASGSSRRHLSERTNDESSKIIEIDSLTSSPSTDTVFRNNTNNNNHNRRSKLRSSFNNKANTEEEDMDSDAPFRMDDILSATAAPVSGRRKLSLKPSRSHAASQSSTLIREDSEMNKPSSGRNNDSVSTLESTRESSGQIPSTIDSSASQSSEQNFPTASSPKISGAEDEHDEGGNIHSTAIESPSQSRREIIVDASHDNTLSSGFLDENILANPRLQKSNGTPVKKLSSRRKLSQPSTGPLLLQTQRGSEQPEEESSQPPQQEPPTRRGDNALTDLELKPKTDSAQLRQPLRQKSEKRSQDFLTDAQLNPPSSSAPTSQQRAEQQTTVEAEELLQDIQVPQPQPPATVPNYHQEATVPAPAPQPVKSAMRKNKKEIDPDIPMVLNIDLSDDSYMSDDDEDTFAVETVATEESNVDSVYGKVASHDRRSRPESPAWNDSPPRRVNRTLSGDAHASSSPPQPQPFSQRRRLRPHQNATNNVIGILHRENSQPQRPNLVGSKQAEISQRSRIMEYKPPEVAPANPIDEDMFLKNPNRQRPAGATLLSERRRMRQKPATPIDTGMSHRLVTDPNRPPQFEDRRGYQDNETVVQANRMPVRPLHTNQYQTASLMADQRSNSIGNISMGSVGEISAVTNDHSMSHNVSSSHLSLGTGFVSTGNMSANTGIVSNGVVSHTNMSASTNNSGGNRVSENGLSEAEEQALEEKLMRIAIEQSLAESQGAPVVPDPLGLSQHNSPTPHYISPQPPTTNYYQGVNQPMMNHPASPPFYPGVSPPSHTNYYAVVQQPVQTHLQTQIPQPAVVPINHGISPPLSRSISQPDAPISFQPPVPVQQTPVARIDNFGPSATSGPRPDANQTDPATAARLAEIEEENRMLEIAIQQSLREAEATPASVAALSYFRQSHGAPQNARQISPPTRLISPSRQRNISSRQQSPGRRATSRSRGSFDDTVSNRSIRGRITRDSSNRSILSRDSSSNRSLLSRESSTRSMEAGMDDIVPASVTQSRISGRSGRVRLRHL